ncbi:pyrimidine-nucleoside phosphorylase/thymidine phosphorylase [Thermosporothrix hazakensis]|jgi:pyrimidine-nucleoside phosphorylase|uniref:Pyrimidine-nucleoside phosphorylase/thymidine phosphorylase n=2 Tax=Thermosporothrix TaxID=768650 RepID=A0A326U565_THEHA|nr:thymidine phosphorylase [Thermosporothrix hazakensis]PZW20797.1 pyrimidine-nucleoside phosphorylase/thymidine phosphorylase [Thermosporothrix hazakensis]BBH89366.1 thymidine phosphorylase [Thermosporothrix sp. COM3]GCE47548.1 thymidine phosphorylase [Thermosporothrix hazakensis]
MQAVDIIAKKRDGRILSAEEIRHFIEHYTRDQIPDYQVAAWLMAVYLQGMNTDEVHALTSAMVESGEQLRIRDTLSPVVDKHSTGGVGDKVTLAVAPLVAACGVAVGKMSGRGLGHTGGTLDKLESVPGFRVELSQQEFLDTLQKHQLVLAGQSQELAPADGKLYALRDVTGTVGSLPLIASSIMSKKLAIGCSHLLLDVKFGSGALLKPVEQARELAQIMVAIGKQAGMHTVATLTSMAQPLGAAIGNALELAEAIAILRGEGPADVRELCYYEASELLVMTGKAPNMEEAHQQVMQVILRGEAVAKLAEVIAAQGGDGSMIERPEKLPAAPARLIVKAPRSGYIAAIEAEQMGRASMHLGAGRVRKGEPIDHRTGFVLQAKIGDYVHAGDALLEIHARTVAEAEAIQPAVLACYAWSEEPTQPLPLIFETVH